MAGKVQRVPRGLLAFLDARGTGQNPSILGDQVIPTVHLDPFYLSQDITSAQDQTLGATNVGDQADIFVPQGEVWKVLSFGVSLTTFTGAVGFPIQGAIQVISPGAPFGVEVGTLEAAGVNAANDQIFAAAPVPQDIVLPSGAEMQFWLGTDLGAVTCTINFRVLFQRLIA